eukprot:TRINITY_DN77097_c0_g1_i1.p1 TRINITY_DN77097_c0_g1~~TRINITY_DN77097_c0_g1_i1.p1  ORF type:complete len:225 (+),score=41.14 TRINITY_DN77097_c0_g1_i1:124-798(+)
MGVHLPEQVGTTDTAPCLEGFETSVDTDGADGCYDDEIDPTSRSIVRVKGWDHDSAVPIGSEQNLVDTSDAKIGVMSGGGGRSPSHPNGTAAGSDASTSRAQSPGNGSVSAQLRAEACELERRLGIVVNQCRQARSDAADATAERRTLAWQAESLELRLREGTHNPEVLQASLRRMQEDRANLEALYTSELASLRERLTAAVEVNADLRRRATELERQAHIMRA